MSRKPTWRKLYMIGLVACVGLVWELQLQVPEAIHHFLLIIWVLLVYGALSLWLMSNSAALAEHPQKIVDVPAVDEFFDADRIKLQQNEDVETHEGGFHV